MQVNRVRDRLYWAYANLAMAHAAVSDGVTIFQRRHFLIRSRLFQGLTNGTMSIGPLADDERLKMILPQACAYCGVRQNLSVDHLIPRLKGGLDAGENMVWACRRCNSSKGATDVLLWLAGQGRFPPLLLLRRYLKLAITYCEDRGVMDAAVEDPPTLPFQLDAIPIDFPPPSRLVLWQVTLPSGRSSEPPGISQGKKSV